MLMKFLVIFVTYIAICAGSFIPMISKNIEVNTNLEEKDDWTRLDDVIDKKNLIENAYNEVGPSAADNEYWLFTRKNPTSPQIITHGAVNSISNSNYDASKPLKVIAHGWTQSGQASVNTMITSAYLETSDVNVIVLDWRRSASGDYISACTRVPGVGRELGNFVAWLLRNGGGDWNSVHLIGYSLGAHLVGNAGRAVVFGTPRRVTGLDPAGPLWSENPFALNAEAGQFVEVIHTNILGRGITEPIGHADFYPNGGRVQPGCGVDNLCDHARSYQFFASSVRTNHFVGNRCYTLLQAIFSTCHGETLNMGNGILDKTGRGIYWLTTRSSWPF